MGFKLRRPPSLSAKHDAYPYQLDAVRALRSLPYAAIFHEQGLGKTKIAIDLMLCWFSDDSIDTVFVVTKKMLVQNWLDELAIHSHITPSVLSGDRRENAIALNSPVLIYVLNYEVVSANVDLIREFLHTCRVGVILDESQKIKNPEARVTTCFQAIAGGFARRIVMTGTPSANRPYDIWSQVKFLDDGHALGNSYAMFREEHELPSSAGESEVDQYGRRLTRIMERIRSFSIRETKHTAGLQLPSKTIRTHLVEMAPRQADMYNSYRDSLAWELREEVQGVVDDAEGILKRLLRLVQCASNPSLVDRTYTECPGKLPKLVGLLEDVNRSHAKAVIWTKFVNNVEWLTGRLEEYGPQKVHGRMSVDDRNESIRRFKTNDDCRLLIATPGTAKEGLTLTVANHAIFYDRGFSLDDYLQAQDRIHRISQNAECFVHNLIAVNTIDEWVDVLLNAKHHAARLVQGDASLKEFNAAFRGDVAEALRAILTPNG